MLIVVVEPKEVNVGISAATIERNAGVPEEPSGAAKKVFAVWLMRFNDNVPEDVTGLPETVYITPGADNPTDVTVPPEEVEAIVILDPEGVIVIPVPATKVRAPTSPLRLVTPPAPPPDTGRSI